MNRKQFLAWSTGIAFLLLHFFPHHSFSQIAGITFDKLAYDLGTFPEDSEMKRCIFRFTNHRKEAIAIAQVQSTCGCATSQYTKKAIPPGKSGEITVAYNPQGRPGRFSRSVLVCFSGETEKVHLTIKGTVIPGAIRKNKSYPYIMGDLQLRTTGFRFAPMRGDAQEQRILVVNSGQKPLRLQLHSSDISLSGYMQPDVLAPDSVGEIRINRKADATKTQAKCVRIKENKTHPNKNGCVYIEIVTEKCQ